MLVIKDANIFFDLYDIGLLDQLFVMGFEVLVTDFVAEEIKSNQGQMDKFRNLINQNFIKILVSSEIEIAGVLELKAVLSPGLSLADCSNIYFARQMKALLLTNDNLLRKTARNLNLEVHGILWLFDLWIEKKILTPKFAAEKLTLLSIVNTWLPKHEIEKRLLVWGEIGL